MLAHPSRPIDDPSHAFFDGQKLRMASDGAVLDRYDERRELITHILVQPGVTAIQEGGWEKGAFWGCTSLTSITFPEELTTVGEYTFHGCTSLSSLILPEGLTTLGEGAFVGCTSLTFVTLPEGITTLGDNAFYGCSSLSSTILPEGLTTIGDNAFYECISLSSLILPEGLTAIGDEAFYDCTILEQRSRAAGHLTVESYLRLISSRANRRYAVLASLARLRSELYAHQAADDALEEEDEKEEEALEEEEELEEQAGVLRGALAFEIIHSDDLWRHMLEFV